MIGGCDIIIPISIGSSNQVLCNVIQSIMLHWKELIVESFDGERYDCKKELSFSKNLLVYQDEIAYKAWEIGIAGEINKNTMIQLIINDDELTMVVGDNSDSEMEAIVRSVKNLVQES